MPPKHPVDAGGRVGETCRLVNPWPGQRVALVRDGTSAGELSGELLEFPTRNGETIVLHAAGAEPKTIAVLSS